MCWKIVKESFRIYCVPDTAVSNRLDETGEDKHVLFLHFVLGLVEKYLQKTSATILKLQHEILRFPNAVVLNAVGRRNTQKSANERK